MIKNMNSKMITNSQLSTTEPKTNKQTKQTTRTGTDSQKQRSHGGLSAGRVWGKNGGTGTGTKKHRWQVQNRQRQFKDSMGNEEAKEVGLKEEHTKAHDNYVSQY